MSVQQQAMIRAQSAFNILSDIQPKIHVCGLSDEAGKIIEAKKDLAALIGTLTPVHPNLERVVRSCRIDALSSFAAVRDQFQVGEDADKLTDEYLQMMMMAAEHFVARCQDYLSSKASLEQLNGGC